MRRDGPGRRRIRRGERGSAMTELVILILPYALILLGVLVIGFLALGRLTSQKASITALSLPEVQDWTVIEPLVGPTLVSDDRAVFSFEESDTYLPPQSYTDEEPVLPYADSSEAGAHNDIHAGLVRVGTRVVSSTQMVNDRPVTTERTFTTGRGRLIAALELERFEDDIARALNDWIRYTRATTEFSFTQGGNLLPREEEPGPDQDFRSTFTLHGHGEEPGISYYAAWRTGEGRGSHRPEGATEFGEPDVDIDEIDRLPSLAGADIHGMDDPTDLYGGGQTPWSTTADSDAWWRPELAVAAPDGP